MDWALFVAVLSLLFTGVVSFITIRYTKRSLELAEQSSAISNESLTAAKKSIETSIAIYEKQKNDAELDKKSASDAKLKAIKNTIKYDVLGIYNFYLELLNVVNCIKNMNKFDLSYEKFFKNQLVVVGGGFFYSCFVDRISLQKTDNYMFDSFLLDEELAHLIVSVGYEYIRIERCVTQIIFLLNKKDMESLKTLIIKMDKNFSDYKNLLENIFDKCNSGGKTLQELLESSCKV
ncbi:hypothetical protein [Proteus mirabilis]|uniref:hypothetical protein n=1 Tax=Proteus mirabilis TaxID=584 RepID=UPI0034D72F16